MGLFSTKEKIALLQKSQENLELSQQNVSLAVAALGQMVPAAPEAQTAEMSDDMKRRAAYALNLCMVSVSQIVDYDDINILDQEYETILNNLNLEQMPKDEALLNILKQLLDTITFFRIQEKEKLFIDKRYQRKMQEAIWSSVPNMSILVSGGGWASMAFSLVCQVGTGYMNYRKTKAAIQDERELEEWKLQRAAMEQFNGLRRELFDTAWRLADTYAFPDAYRITERQISRYNAILMDTEYLRRYERLDYIKDQFEAYPPFWYFLGNAANMVFQDSRYDAETRARYRELAKAHFEHFMNQSRERDLLREDQLLASCALEYFDLLAGTAEGDPAYLSELLERAIAVSGTAFDVVQLCAINYLRMGNQGRCVELLRMLINEEYNTTVNIQLLSYLYTNAYVHSSDPGAAALYRSMAVRFNEQALFPMPADTAGEPDMEQLQGVFVENQKKFLRQKYDLVLSILKDRYIIKMNKGLPTASRHKKYGDHYFGDDYLETRKEDVGLVFEHKRARQDYLDRLKDADIQQLVVDVVNACYGVAIRLPFVQDEEARSALRRDISSDIKDRNKILEPLLKGLENDTFDISNYSALQRCLNGIVSDVFYRLRARAENSVAALDSMARITNAESQTEALFESLDIPYPDTVHAAPLVAARSEDPAPFTIAVFGATKQQTDAAAKRKKKLEFLKNSEDFAGIVKSGEKHVEVYIRGSSEYDSYLERHKGDLGQQGQILAIINDTSVRDVDLILAADGMCVLRGVLGKYKFALPSFTPYKDVQRTGDRKPTLKIDDRKYSNDGVDIGKLYAVIKRLEEIEAE